MLIENPGFCHWCTLHLYELFQIPSFTCTKDSSSIPGLSNGGFILLPGKLKQTLSELTKAMTGFSSRLQLRMYWQFSSHTALLIWKSFPFYKGNAHHYSILQTVKTRDKILQGLPKRQPVDRGGTHHLLCLTPREPRTYQFLGLSQVTSCSQCNRWMMFVEAFKYGERKQILK